MALVSSNVSLEPCDGSRSQKSYNNVKRMLSVVYFHCKTIRNAANFEKSRSKISHCRPTKSWRDWYTMDIFVVKCLLSLEIKVIWSK